MAKPNGDFKDVLGDTFSWSNLASYLSNIAVGGKEAAQLKLVSDGIGLVQGALNQIDAKIDLGAKDFTLFGAIGYWDNILGKMKDANQELGIAGNLGINLQDSFKGAYASVVEMGIKEEELAKTIKSYFDKTGRAQILSSNQMAELGKMADVFGDESLEIVQTYGRVGIGITTATSKMRNLIVQSDKFGVLPTKVSGILKNNIDAVNKYSFKNGVKALEQMAIYAAKTNTDMKSAFNVADKLLDNSIEGAMEMSTSLQLMGGSFGNMGDMSELIYLARNEPEKFQEMFSKAAAGMAQFNEKTGQIEFNAEGMQRLRAVAKETGADLSELVESGRALKKSMIIKDELDSSIKGLSNYDALLTKVSGAAYRNDLGEWVVNIKEGGKEMQKAVSALTEEQIKQISFTDETKGPEQAFENIAKSNETLNETLTRLIDTIKVQAISTGAFEQFNVVARNAADNIKVIAQPFIESVQSLMNTATNNMLNVVKPLSEGNLGGALNAAGQNFADTGKAVWGLTKDVGQMLYNIFANAAKFLAAGIEWGFRKGMAYLGNAFIDLYNTTFGRAFGEAKRYEPEDINFSKILEGYDLKGVLEGTSFEKWWEGISGGKPTSTPTTTTSTTPNVTNTSVTETKKEPEAIEKKMTSTAEEKTKKVEVEFKNGVSINVLGNSTLLSEGNVIEEKVKQIFRVDSYFKGD